MVTITVYNSNYWDERTRIWCQNVSKRERNVSKNKKSNHMRCSFLSHKVIHEYGRIHMYLKQFLNNIKIKYSGYFTVTGVEVVL
jgi:hypothetical protein